MSEPKSPKTHHLSIWGIILVFLGGVLLLQNFDVLPWDMWAVLWRFWPMLLVIIGLNIIIDRCKTWVAAIVILAVLGAALGLAIWQYQSPLLREDISTYSEPRDDLQEALIQIDFHAGNLNLSALPPDSPNLVEAVSREDALTADFRRQDTVGNLRLNNTWKRRPPWMRMGWVAWNVKLAEDIPLTIKLNSSAADVDLDLRHFKVPRLNLELNAGKSKVMKPSGEGVTRAFIVANAANIEITIPEGVAVRIDVDVNAGVLEIDESRFPKKGAYYISPGFEVATNQIYLNIELNAGRLKVL